MAWAYLKRFSAPIPGVETNESELRVDFPNGGRVRLYGADNYDRLRGLYLDGVVLDEPADMDPRAWPEVIRPALADRQGWATFIGTPKGRNSFYEIWDRAGTDPSWFRAMLRASETGLVPQSELDDLRKALTPEQYEQELECSFEAAILGAYYGKEIADAEKAGRIKDIPYEPGLPVHVSYDLGIGDSTALWFFQVAHDGVRFIDHYESHGQPLAHYAGVIASKPYTVTTDWVPHDARVRELGTGRTRVETLKELGRSPRLVPNHKLEDGINAARVGFSRFWFDEVKCRYGLEALRQYRTDFDEKTRAFKNTPKHDWCFTGDTKILTRYGTQQIMSLPKSGEVLTSCGWKPYHSPRITRRAAPLVEVTFDGGFTVRCTPDHLFKTVNGWKSADSLATGSLIQSSLTLSRCISMVAYTVVGQVIGIGRGVVKSCIETFGSRLSDLFQSGAISIIGTATPTTTVWPIWNAWKVQITFQRRGTNPTRIVQFQTRPDQPPQNGTGRKRGGFGISDTRSGQSLGRNGSVKNAHAATAERLSKLSRERAGTLKSIVALTAKPLRVASVRPLSETADVWCLTVPEAEEFSLANGAVVHNCSHSADAFRYAAIAWRELSPDPAPQDVMKQILKPKTFDQVIAEFEEEEAE